MTPQHIHHELIAINNKLSRIFKSDAWAEILNMSEAHHTLEETLGDTIHYTGELKLKVSQAIQNLKEAA